MTEITAGFTYQGDGWQLRSAQATHAEPTLDCLGFSVEAGDKKFVYSGDTAINNDIKALSRDADVLLHWCYRGAGERLHPALQAFSPDPGEVADMAQSVGVKTLLLSHFRIHMDNAEGHQRALDDMSARFQGTAGIVEDLDVFEI